MLATKLSQPENDWANTDMISGQFKVIMAQVQELLTGFAENFLRWNMPQLKKCYTTDTLASECDNMNKKFEPLLVQLQREMEIVDGRIADRVAR